MMISTLSVVFLPVQWKGVVSTLSGFGYMCYWRLPPPQPHARLYVRRVCELIEYSYPLQRVRTQQLSQVPLEGVGAAGDVQHVRVQSHQLAALGVQATARGIDQHGSEAVRVLRRGRGRRRGSGAGSSSSVNTFILGTHAIRSRAWGWSCRSRPALCPRYRGAFDTFGAGGIWTQCVHLFAQDAECEVRGVAGHHVRIIDAVEGEVVPGGGAQGGAELHG
mmetsp:Transcript_25637/g.57979  ORF Transcript_25637/g.57979 Transcript_25637/m.57979 type:complete len:220 (+) Transcript_25637:65-724(+)